MAAAPLGVILVGAAMAAGTSTSASPATVPYQSRDKDEDPFALLGPDGTAYVFWFSNRLRDGELHSDIVYTTYKSGKFGASTTSAVIHQGQSETSIRPRCSTLMASFTCPGFAF